MTFDCFTTFLHFITERKCSPKCANSWPIFWVRGRNFRMKKKWKKKNIQNWKIFFGADLKKQKKHIVWIISQVLLSLIPQNVWHLWYRLLPVCSSLMKVSLSLLMVKLVRCMNLLFWQADTDIRLCVAWCNRITPRSMWAHHVLIRRLLILDGAEASQALVVHVDPPGVTRGHQHVDTHVELEAVDEQRLAGSGGTG